MRRNRRNNVKKERIIMIASSAFVLSALTMTGIYMKSNNVEEQDDGYLLDFTSLEETVPEKVGEIAKNNEVPGEPADAVDGQAGTLEDDLDYLPMEAGSGMVTIPGLTDGLLEDTPAGEGILSPEAEPQAAGEQNMAGSADLSAGNTSNAAASEASVLGGDDAPGLAAGGNAVNEAPEKPASEATGQDEAPSGESPEEGSAQSGDTESTAGGDVVAETLHFAESEGLLRPVSGEVLIPFSMDSSVYFSTLDQFKYNPAMMIQAQEGTAVAACAEGVVIDIFQDEEIGHAITMDLGDGYQLTYGQLYDINVTMNSHVQAGENIACVAAPTKYFSVEGSNLYLKLTANGTPVNPEALFR